MASSGDKADKAHTDTFAVVGKLVMMANALDYETGSVIISVSDIGGSDWTSTIIATLDLRRKLEILRAHAAHLRSEELRKDVTRFCDKVDGVLRQRDIACHTPAPLENGEWKFKPVATAKMLKRLDPKKGSLRHTRVEDFKSAIRRGEEALWLGRKLIESFGPLHAKVRHRAAAK